MIWERKLYFYQTGVNLIEEDLKGYHIRKDLKNNFDNIVYFLNKANKIVKDFGRHFSWKEFDALYFNRKVIVHINPSKSINIIKQIIK